MLLVLFYHMLFIDKMLYLYKILGPLDWNLIGELVLWRYKREMRNDMKTVKFILHNKYVYLFTSLFLLTNLSTTIAKHS